jgi:hypothetical protein
LDLELKNAFINVDVNVLGLVDAQLQGLGALIYVV